MTQVTVDIPAHLLKELKRKGQDPRSFILKAARKALALEQAPATDKPEPGHRRWWFSGTLDAPIEAKRDDVLAYLDDAVGTMRGCYHPEDPMSETSNVQSMKAGLAKSR